MSKIVTTKYKITSSKLKEDIRILLMSDLHYKTPNHIEKLNTIKEEIKNIKPTYICIPGDLLDDSRPKEEKILLDWLTTLGKIAPIIISLGNHDVTTKKEKKVIYDANEELWKKIASIPNVTLLDNDIYETKAIRMIGITLPFDYYHNGHENKNKLVPIINQIFPKQAQSDKLNIILCHTPIHLFDSTIYKQIHLFQKSDLILCGHMHGGMVPHKMHKILKQKGLIGPFKKPFPKTAYGYYKKHNIIITSGITKLSNRSKLESLDFLWSSELVIIDIKKQFPSESSD